MHSAQDLSSNNSSSLEEAKKKLLNYCSTAMKSNHSFQNTLKHLSTGNLLKKNCPHLGMAIAEP